MNRVLANIETMEVPDSEQCKNFHGCVLTYAKNNLVIISVYKDKVLPYVKLHNPSAENDSSAVETMLSESFAEDDRLLAEVSAAQAIMAKKYKFKLE
jgi:hypothetical protein